MARPAPTWAVYRRASPSGLVPFELVGIVEADFEGQAAALAAMLPDVPRYPILCRALPGFGRTPALTLADLAATVGPAPIKGTGRRSRKRRLAGAAAVAQAQAVAA